MARRNNLLPLAVVGALAVLLALIAIPSFVAAMVSGATNTTIERIREGQAPPPAAIQDAARGQAAAAALFESARYNANASAALFKLSPADRARTGLDAEQLVARSLAAAPASPHNWLRLAYVRLAKGDRPGAVKAWRMSVLTGRYVPNIMAQRLALAFLIFPTTDAEFVNLVVDQIRLEAQVDMEGLAWLARGRGAEPYIRAVLWRDTDQSGAFRKAYDGLLWRERNPSR